MNLKSFFKFFGFARMGITSRDGAAPKRAAIVLSGCGVYDGTEITEAVCAVLAAERAGAVPVFFAPDTAQAETLDHSTGKPVPEKRGVLAESARIARGNIAPLSEFRPENFDALIFPGGFGAAKNLSTFASEGAGCSVLADVEKAVLGMFEAGKPVGFICISPASVAARVLGKFGVELTVGGEGDAAAAVEACGAKHVGCAPESFVKDPEREVYSTPAYMSANSALQVEAGISKMIGAMLK